MEQMPAENAVVSIEKWFNQKKHLEPEKFSI